MVCSAADFPQNCRVKGIAVGTESCVAGCFRDRKADDALEPLAMFIDERDGGDGYAAHLGSQAGKVIKSVFGGRI